MHARVRTRTRTHTHTYRESQIYFRELAYMIVGAGKSDLQGRLEILAGVSMQTRGRLQCNLEAEFLPLPGTSVFSLKRPTHRVNGNLIYSKSIINMLVTSKEYLHSYI